MTLSNRQSSGTPSPPPPPSTQPAARPSKIAKNACLVEAFGGVVKKRASKACICCRRRKVRCDVSDFGSPCSNCRYDNVICMVKESRRNRQQSTEDAQIATSGFTIGRQDVRDSASATWEKDLDGVNLEEAAAPECYGIDEELHVPHLIYQMQEQRADTRKPRTKPKVSDSTFNVSHQVYKLPTVYGHHTGGHVEIPVKPTIEIQPPTVDQISPIFKKLPNRITEDDIEYLSTKGALSIPETQLRNELLRCYIENVHSFMPILDLNEFLNIIEAGDGRNGQLSLLLFQCVMFAGSASIPFEYLKAVGFTTRFEARKAFFTRARVLYDLDCESSHIPLVQSLLLMTHWYETPNDQKDLWYWMGVVSSLSLQIGLHNYIPDTKIPLKTQKLHKRLGWYCFVRDQLVALGTLRSTRIKDSEHTLPMLNLVDFDLEPVPKSISCVSTDCVVARDEVQICALASTCIEVAKLSLCISRILSTQYTIGKDVSESAYLGAKMNFLHPRNDGSDNEIVRKCDLELSFWRAECAEDARHTEVSKEDALKGQEPLMVHRALLDMLYNTAVITLHRPQTCQPDPSLAQQDSQSKAHAAAHAITTRACFLLTHNFIPLLPSQGVSVLLHAIMVHLSAATFEDVSVRQLGLVAFIKCMEALQQMRDVHNGADVIIKRAELGMKKGFTTRVRDSPGRQSSTESASNSSNPPKNEGSPGRSERNRQLEAVLGARTYTSPTHRSPSAEIVAPDPRPFLNGSGVLVDGKLSGGLTIAQALLETVFGYGDRESTLGADGSDGGNDMNELHHQSGGPLVEMETALEMGMHHDFMEYVDTMVDFEGLTGEHVEIKEEISGEDSTMPDTRTDGQDETGMAMDIDIEPIADAVKETETEISSPAVIDDSYGKLLLDMETLRSRFP